MYSIEMLMKNNVQQPVVFYPCMILPFLSTGMSSFLRGETGRKSILNNFSMKEQEDLVVYFPNYIIIIILTYYSILGILSNIEDLENCPVP